MKRFFIVCLCLSLLSLLIVPALAEERFISPEDNSLRDVSRGQKIQYLSFYPSVSYTHIPSSMGLYWTGYVFIDGTSFPFRSVYFNADSSFPVLTYQTESINVPLINNDGSFVDGWDGIVYFDYVNSMNSSAFLSWYNSFPSPLDNFGVSDGVSTSIGWFGSVLSNLVASPAVLSLVGLAVALFCVLPFGITTIKNLMKGY